MFLRVFFLAVFLLLVTYCVCESHYSILGVSKNAKNKEIKKAYIKLAQIWHPDKNKGENAKYMMSKINKAYEILSDEDKRRHYDLLEYEPSDDDYKYSTSEDDDSSHRSQSTDDEINTEQFMNSVLPASERTPYLIYFFHDFCEKCEEWTEELDTIKKDLQSIGVRMASVNVIVSNKVASHCNVYVHEVPQLVVVINRKSHPFTGSMIHNILEELKQLIYDKLPSDITKPVDNADDILSMETRIVNNKPVVLLVSPQNTPSLEYKLSAYHYQQYMMFYYLPSLSKDNSELDVLKKINVTRSEEVLLIYSDVNDPAVILTGDELNKMIKVFDSNKWLSVPRVNSCSILDELCPNGNKRSCVLLVANGNEKVAENFRAFVRNQSDINFNTGILNPNQNSALKSTISWDQYTVDNAGSCNNSEVSPRPVVIIRRLTESKLEYIVVSSYCGSSSDNTRLLELVGHSKYKTINTAQCVFDPEPTISPEELYLHTRVHGHVYEYMEWIILLGEQWIRAPQDTTINWNVIWFGGVIVLCYVLLVILPVYITFRKMKSSQAEMKTEIKRKLDLLDERMKASEAGIKTQIEERCDLLDKQMRDGLAKMKTQIEEKCESLNEQMQASQTEMKTQIKQRCDSLDEQIKDGQAEMKTQIEKTCGLLDKQMQASQKKIKSQIEDRCDSLDQQIKAAIQTNETEMKRQTKQQMERCDSLDKQLQASQTGMKTKIEEKCGLLQKLMQASQTEMKMQIIQRCDSLDEQIKDGQAEMKTQIEKTCGLLDKQMQASQTKIKSQIEDRCDSLDKQIKAAIQTNQTEMKRQTKVQMERCDTLDKQMKESQTKMKTQIEQRCNSIDEQIKANETAIKSQTEEQKKKCGSLDEQIQDGLAKMKTQIEDKFGMLDGRMKTSEADIKTQIEKRCDSLDEQMKDGQSEMKTQKEEQMTKCNLLDKQIRDSQAAIQTSQEEMKTQIEEEMKVLQTSQAQTKSQIEEQMKKCKSLDEQIKDSHAAIQTSQKEMKTQIEEEMKGIQTSQAQIDRQMKSQIEEQMKRCNSLDKQCALLDEQMKTELQAIQKMVEELRGSLDKQKKASQKEILTIQGEMKRIEEMCGSLDEQNETKQGKIQTIQEEIKKIEKMCDNQIKAVQEKLVAQFGSVNSKEQIEEKHSSLVEPVKEINEFEKTQIEEKGDSANGTGKLAETDQEN